ncbi:MAG: lipase, partial [Chloroflexus sp.]
MNTTPILIVGGFGSDPQLYKPLCTYLGEVSGRPVFITPINRIDWAWVTLTDSYAELLRKLDRTVNELL